jgi:hypothetical protein
MLKNSQSVILERKSFALLMALFGVIFFYVVFESHHLRPSGDDYCYGAVTAEYGLFGGVVEWWNTWSGFAFAMFSANLLIGLPLAYLPFEFASSITFILSALGMGLTIWCIYRSALPSTPFPSSAIIFLAVCWWTFIWVSPALHGNIHKDFANGLTFWQSLNGQYAIPFQFLIGILVLNWPKEKSCLQIQLLLIAPLIGVLSGTAGTAISTTFIVAGAGLGCWTYFKNKRFNRAVYFWVILCATALIAAAACHLFSPGSVGRAQILDPNLNLSIERVLSITEETVWGGSKIWLKIYFGLGGLTVTFLATLFSYAYTKTKGICYSKRVLLLAFWLGAFAYLQCLINRFSEEFTYQGYWHYLDATICGFISIIFIGFWIGSYLADCKFQGIYKVLMLVIFGAAISASIKANLFMVERMQWRSQEWAVGPSEIDGISDIGSAGGFELDCWNRLNKLRPSILIRSKP